MGTVTEIFWQSHKMTEKLNRSLLYTYGIADLGFVLMVSMELYFFSAFLTDIAKFSLPLTGFVLGFTNVADIVCALIAGVILQKVTLKSGGKYRSWFLVGPPLVAVLFILQFSKIGSHITAALIISFGFVASHLLWNVVFTASASMVGRLSNSPAETTILSTSRAQGMSSAQIIFSLTSVPVIAFFTAHTSEIAGYSLASGVYVFFMVLGYWYIYGMTSGKDPYDEAITDPSGRETGLSVKDMVGLVFKNSPLLLLILAEAFRNTYILIISSFAFYYCKYVLDDYDFLIAFILSINIARLAGTFIASWMGVKIGKRKAYWLFLIFAATAFGSAKFLGGSAWSFTAIFCIGSTLGMVASSLSTALFSDTVVYGEWKTGRSNRAFTMALQSFSIKLSVLFRSAVITFGLMAIDFEADMESTPEVVEGISSIMVFTPVIVCLVSAAIFYFGYKLDDQKVLQMEEQIAAKKQ
jgi:Na+/melibiose symporter-like transporter